MLPNSKPEIYQTNPRTIQLHEIDCGLACIHTLANFYQLDLQCTLPETNNIIGTDNNSGQFQCILQEAHRNEMGSNEENFDSDLNDYKNHFNSEDKLPTLDDFKSILPKGMTQKMKTLEKEYIKRIKHIQNFQRRLMHIKKLPISPRDVIQPWTIDYAYYIRYCLPCQFLFCTQQIGVHPKYKELQFYADVIKGDFERVNQLFNDAESDNVPVMKVHLEASTLKRILQRSDIFAIVVVDSNRMKCMLCEFVPSEEDLSEDIGEDDSQSSSSSTTTSWESVPTESDFGSIDDSDFAGHFILLVDADDSRIFYKDSSPTSCNTCVCDASRFEKARLAFGTDEDIILISMDQQLDIRKIVAKELEEEENLKQMNDRTILPTSETESDCMEIVSN